MPLPRITELAHYLVGTILREGDHAVDATAGNGHDTAFLARLVGESGRVDSFDIQPRAIGSTRVRTAGLTQVRLHQVGHEQIAKVVGRPVQAVMFNLGYLPSGDKELITKPETTLAALEASLALLDRGGLITTIVYPAHDGGADEASIVGEWFALLCRKTHRVLKFGDWPTPAPPTEAKKKPAPYLFAAERKK